MSSSMLQDATKQASAVTVTTIKAFTRKSVDITQGNLDRCIEWADEHVRQGDDNEIVFTPMLIFNEEMQGATKTYRKIQAREVKSFLESVHMRNQPLFLHEIAPEDAPIKLAFDIELDFTKKETVEASFQSIDEQLLVEQCNEFCSMLISRCLVLLSQFAGRILHEHGVYQTDCTRKGKFSRHLTFDCSDVEHSSVVFVSDAHCTASRQSQPIRPQRGTHASGSGPSSRMPGPPPCSRTPDRTRRLCPLRWSPASSISAR